MRGLRVDTSDCSTVFLMMSGAFFWAMAVAVVILYLMIVLLGAMRRSRNRSYYRESLLRKRDLDRFDDSERLRDE